MPTPPIVIDENGDIEVFPSVEAAKRDMEAIDVLDGVYVVFDSTGCRLAIGADEGLIQIWLDHDVDPEPEELRERLRHFVARVGPDRVGVADVEAASLEHLIHALSRFFDVSLTSA